MRGGFSAGICLTTLLVIQTTTKGLPVQDVQQDNDMQKDYTKTSENDYLANPMTSAERETQKIKRSCRVGFSNDCGAAHSAFMSGLKNLLSSKRKLEDDNRFFKLKRVGANSQAHTKSLSYKDAIVLEKWISYLKQVAIEKELRREEEEKACIRLTGRPCDQQKMDDETL